MTMLDMKRWMFEQALQYVVCSLRAKRTCRCPVVLVPNFNFSTVRRRFLLDAGMQLVAVEQRRFNDRTHRIDLLPDAQQCGEGGDVIFRQRPPLFVWRPPACLHVRILVVHL